MTQRRVSGPVSDTELIYSPDTYVRSVPHDALTRLRQSTPVAWVEERPVDDWPAGPGFWAVLRHADVRHVLRNPRLFSSHLGATQIRDAEDLDYVRRMMLNMDPPDHSRLRGLLTKAFTPRAVARLAARIERRARALVDEVVEKGEADFAKEISADLPLLTLADVFGIPESDRWLLFDWSNRVIGYQDAEYSASASFEASRATDMAKRAIALRPTGPVNPRSRAGMPDLYAYAHELGEYKRRHPGDDVMTALMRNDEDGTIAIEEFENLFWLFAVAGNETVRNGLPGGMFALLKNPDQLARLRADRSLLDGAVEEMLRWWTPVMNFRRTATADTVVGNVPVRKGEKVVVWFSSANRDEEVFDRPTRFDVGRTENDHLTFGHGPHFCLGAHLARLQMRAMFGAVLDRLHHIELAGEPIRLRSNFQNGIKRLPIRWNPGP
ncbi:cytochrome P450 [Actinoallomurus bryophytorum]|uniref:Cytochrome P450 n=1 Tax=Actinoallomurus bryophytorum TaxID=1490222 RepID=A0A543CNA5_9ACTN|nr:cytochrome P450 [Actinoallomurus bryophytorum]TQL98584.1 cytochrome P450 [Actinoallomurus bryophytorum]